MPEVGAEVDRFVKDTGRTIAPGDTVRLTCEPTGDPTIEPRWRISPAEDGDHEVLEYIPISTVQEFSLVKLRRLR
jgi:hypothetical protein